MGFKINAVYGKIEKKAAEIEDLRIILQLLLVVSDVQMMAADHGSDR